MDAWHMKTSCILYRHANKRETTSAHTTNRDTVSARIDKGRIWEGWGIVRIKYSNTLKYGVFSTRIDHHCCTRVSGNVIQFNHIVVGTCIKC